MIELVTRVRETDRLRPALISGFQYSSAGVPTARSFSLTSPLLNYKKVIVDKVSKRIHRPLGRGRYRFYRSSAVRKDRLISDVKPVRIQSFKGFCKPGTVDTRGSLPAGWTNFVLTGEWAAGCMNSEAMRASTISGNVFANFTSEPAMSQEIIDWCLEKAWNSCAELEGELGVALAELPQLFALMSSPFKLASTAARTLKKLWRADAWVLDPKKGLVSLRTKRRMPIHKATKNVLDEASNRWLEVQYGLLPTISDAEVVLDAIDDKLQVIREIMYGKSKYTPHNRKFSKTVVVVPVTNFRCEYRLSFEQKITYTSKVYYRYKNVPDLRQRLGFRAESFANFIWELTPWSFVVDWLWDIGGLLHRITHANLITVVSNYVSVKHDQKVLAHVTKCDYQGYNGYYPLRVPSSRLYYHQEELLRVVNQDLPDLPQFNLKWFNVTRSLNALSLLWQNLPR